MSHALEVNADSEVALLGMGTNLHQRGRLPEAAGFLKRALSIDPSDADAHFDYGNVLLAQHQVKSAVMQYELAMAFNLRPNDVRVQINLGAALAMCGNWTQSEKVFRSALQAAPRNASAHSGLGRVLEQRGDFGGALAEYHAALELDPQLPQAQTGQDRILQRFRL